MWQIDQALRVPTFRSVALLVCCAWLSFAHAATQAATQVASRAVPLRIVVADESEITTSIAATLKARFPEGRVLREVSIADLRDRNAIYVTVGPNALNALLSREPDGIVISLFTSSQAYRAILEGWPKTRRSASTGIYAEPSPASQLELVSAVYKRRVQVAVLISDNTAYLAPVLAAAAAQADIDLKIERLGTADDLTRELNLVREASVLLAIPDPRIFTSESVRDILVSTYRRNQAVVGFSAAMVRAGALATTYSSVDDIAEQFEEILNAFLTTGRLPNPQFPRYWRTTINESVARSLNIVVDRTAKSLSHSPARSP